MRLGNVRSRFWIEAVCAVLGGALLLLTLVSPQWIEQIFGIDPDAGSGALELGIAGGLLLFAAVSAWLARNELRLAASRY